MEKKEVKQETKKEPQNLLSGTVKIFETEYNHKGHELVRWTIWTDSNWNEHYYLRLYVDVYGVNKDGDKYGYYFKSHCEQPRSKIAKITPNTADLIMDTENGYDLYNSDISIF